MPAGPVEWHPDRREPEIAGILEAFRQVDAAWIVANGNLAPGIPSDFPGRAASTTAAAPLLDLGQSPRRAAMASTSVFHGGNDGLQDHSRSLRFECKTFAPSRRRGRARAAPWRQADRRLRTRTFRFPHVFRRHDGGHGRSGRLLRTNRGRQSSACGRRLRTGHERASSVDRMAPAQRLHLPGARDAGTVRGPGNRRPGRSG